MFNEYEHIFLGQNGQFFIYLNQLWLTHSQSQTLIVPDGLWYFSYLRWCHRRRFCQSLG